MSLRGISFFILGLVLVILSCKNDDEGLPDVVPERDRAEQQQKDKDSLVKYLTTHYYNSKTINNVEDPSLSDLIITKLPDGTTAAPADHTLLIGAVTTKQTEYLETSYEYYVLEINKGGGDSSPSIADDILVTYEGFTINDNVFDSTANPSTLNLASLIHGWRKVLPDFKAAKSFKENGDGTVDFMDHGLGVMFLPSGLGYFSAPTNGIFPYSPLIFKFELLQTTERDHDSDGVPSYKEDVNGDGDPNNDDTDGDRLPNYIDTDDDADGVLTINEDINKDGDPTNDDTDNDGTPNYLDTDTKESN